MKGISVKELCSETVKERSSIRSGNIIKGEGKRLRIMKEAEGKEKESRVFFYS